MKQRKEVSYYPRTNGKNKKTMVFYTKLLLKWFKDTIWIGVLDILIPYELIDVPIR